MRLHQEMADNGDWRVITPDLPGFEGSSKNIPGLFRRCPLPVFRCFLGLFRCITGTSGWLQYVWRCGH